MNVIETTTVERNGRTFHVTIHADPDAPNPLDEWSEIGTILKPS